MTDGPITPLVFGNGWWSDRRLFERGDCVYYDARNHDGRTGRAMLCPSWAAPRGDAVSERTGSPGFARVLETGLYGERYYAITEPLDELELDRALPPPRAVALLAPLTAALIAAENHGFCCRRLSANDLAFAGGDRLVIADDAFVRASEAEGASHVPALSSLAFALLTGSPPLQTPRPTATQLSRAFEGWMDRCVALERFPSLGDAFQALCDALGVPAPRLDPTGTGVTTYEASLPETVLEWSAAPGHHVVDDSELLLLSTEHSPSCMLMSAHRGTVRWLAPVGSRLNPGEPCAVIALSGAPSDGGER